MDIKTSDFVINRLSLKDIIYINVTFFFSVTLTLLIPIIRYYSLISTEVVDNDGFLILIYFLIIIYTLIALQIYVNYTWKHTQSVTKLFLMLVVSVIFIIFLILHLFIQLPQEFELPINNGIKMMGLFLLFPLSMFSIFLLAEYLIIQYKTKKAIRNNEIIDLVYLILDYPRSLLRYPQPFIPIKAFNHLHSVYSYVHLTDLFIFLYNHDNICMRRLINLRYYTKLFPEESQKILISEYDKMITQRETEFNFNQEMLTVNLNNCFKSNQSMIVWFIIVFFVSYYVLALSSEPEFGGRIEKVGFEFLIPIINIVLFVAINPSNYIIRKRKGIFKYKR